MNTRIDYLDGLRGLAILLVIGYHAYARWPGVVPYDKQYVDISIFKYGWLGVQLFFLISGFVILMSLDKYSSIRKFLYKRWIRLFPAMLIATILIFTSSSFFYERPAGEPELLSLLPGLTFIEPSWWSEILGSKLRELEGAFWTLYVEFKFYIISSILFFYLGRNKLVFSLFFLFACTILLRYAAIHIHIESELLNFAKNISSELSLHYFGWFAAGSAFYVFHKTQKKAWFGFGIFISILSSLTVAVHFSFNATVGALLISSLFSFSLISKKLQLILKSKFLLFFGLVSYPLYLIHENAMISMIIKIGHLLPNIPGYLYPIPPIIILIGMSYIIVKYGEPYLKNIIGTFKKPGSLSDSSDGR